VTTISLPWGPGTSILAGGGAWLPRSGGLQGFGGIRGDEALVLRDPCRLLTATTPDQVPALLGEVEAEQRAGRFVAGYMSYEAGAAFGLTVKSAAPDSPPLAWMAVYRPESALVVSSAEWRHYLDGTDTSEVAQTLAEVEPRLSVSRDEYIEAIARVREFIAAGDTYQVNYTVRGRYELVRGGPNPADAPGVDGASRPTEAAGLIDPLDYFLALVIRQPVPYAAYLDLGDAQVISLSPELFLRRDGDRLESRPMKGTRPRGGTHAADVALAFELAETEKERAENLMIVDMVRNDLGRVCRTGSIQVPVLYAVEPYRTVWQMVSTVTGDVHPRAGLARVMEAVFPGASITGAPKYHTMEIIAALETEPRDVYTGALGCFFPGGDFTCNIAIRTIIHRDGRCRLGTGSGVVWDAVAEAEYEETLAKAAFATPPAADSWRPDPLARLRATGRPRKTEMCLFETILLEAGDVGSAPHNPATPVPGARVNQNPVAKPPSVSLSRFTFLEEHLDRLAASAAAFDYPFDREAALNLLASLAGAHTEPLVIRLKLDSRGDLSRSMRDLQRWPASTPGETAALLVSPFRTDPGDPLLHHKTSLRGFYDREYRRAAGLGCLDALFLNRLDRITEGSITNIAARFDDSWVTPPVEDGLLPGIWRADFIESHGARERSLSLAELLSADEIVVGNSVRGSALVRKLLVDPLEF